MLPNCYSSLVLGNRGTAVPEGTLAVHWQKEREPSFPPRYGTGSADIIWSPFRHLLILRLAVVTYYLTFMIDSVGH